MATNLVQMLTDALGGELINQGTKFLGESKNNTRSAVNAAIPALLSGMIQKSSTQDGATKLLDTLTSANVDTGLLGKLTSMFDNEDKASGVISQGTGLLKDLFGNKLSGIINAISAISGLRSSSASSLLGMAAPFVFGAIKNHVMENKLNAAGLMSLLSGQKEHLRSSLDSRISSALGFASPSAFLGGSAGGSSGTGSSGGNNMNNDFDDEETPWFKKALPLLLPIILVGGLIFLLRGCDSSEEAVDEATQMTEGTTEETAKDIATDTGNIVEESTEAVTDAAENAGDAVENTVDAAGEAASDAGKAVTETVEKATEAASDSADKLADATKDLAEGAGDLAESAADTAEGAAESVADAADATADKASELLSGTTKAVGDAAEKATDTAADAADAVTDTLKDAASKTKEAAETVANEVVDGVKSLTLPDGTAINSAAGGFTDSFASALSSGEISDKGFTLDGVKFATGSARLTADSITQIKELASVMKAYPNVQIRVEGHTDSSGNAATNKKLSASRAASVKAALTKNGVTGARVTTEGYGSEKPVADNDSPENMAKNRRVDVVVTKK